MIRVLKEQGFTEISIPIIQSQETFTGKVGAENNNLMYNFKDRGDRDICLAPEYTAVIQKLSKTTFKNDRNVKVFYVQECFRGEKPQAGRFRQFTQLGVEIINPDNDYNDYLQKIAYSLIELSGRSIVLNTGVTRGLDYYTEGKGFEIACDELGSSKPEERDRNPVTRLLRKKYIDSIVLIYKSKNYMSLVHRIHLMTDAENNTTCS